MPKNPFPILMYHALWNGDPGSAETRAAWSGDPQLREPGARRYAFPGDVFETHLQAIAAAGKQTPRDWAGLAAPSGRSIWITFDDGHRSNSSIALPLLRQHGMTGIFFITTDWIGKPGFMTEGELRELRAAGMLLGTHGCSHRYFSDLNAAELERELIESKRKLEFILGEAVAALALPGGRDHPELRRIAKQAEYRWVLTSRCALADEGDDPFDLPRVAMLNTQPAGFLAGLLTGDSAPLAAQARAAARRALAKRVLGNALYDKLRGLVVRG